ncbi:hypothetical protein ACOART_10495, partial [Glaesserella parasuis]
AYIYTTCLMAQGAKQLYFLYNPIMKVLVMGFSFAHILIQGANGAGKVPFYVRYWVLKQNCIGKFSLQTNRLLPIHHNS